MDMTNILLDCKLGHDMSLLLGDSHMNKHESIVTILQKESRNRPLTL